VTDPEEGQPTTTTPTTPAVAASTTLSVPKPDPTTSASSGSSTPRKTSWGVPNLNNLFGGAKSAVEKGDSKDGKDKRVPPSLSLKRADPSHRQSHPGTPLLEPPQSSGTVTSPSTSTSNAESNQSAEESTQKEETSPAEEVHIPDTPVDSDSLQHAIEEEMTSDLSDIALDKADQQSRDVVKIIVEFLDPVDVHLNARGEGEMASMVIAKVSLSHRKD